MAFHAGGAINFIDQFDPAIYGLISRLSDLNFTHYGSVVAIAGILPAGWRFLRQAWRETASWVKHFFISSVTIPAGDPVNRAVSSWVLENVIKPRHMRFHTARTEIGRDSEPGAILKKRQLLVEYLPHWESVWFRQQSNFFFIHRSLDSFKASLNDPSNDTVGNVELKISILGLSADPIQKFIASCREFAEKKAQYYVLIWSRDRYGLTWKPKYRKPLRRLESVHFDDDAKQALIADVRNYLDPRTQQLYLSRSMPYRRGYLFFGPPGTGKTSLSTAIAGEFGMDLYEVKVPSIANDGELEQMFLEIPPRCIVLLEDIDAVWRGREQPRERAFNDGSGDNSSTISNVTLSGLLNVLDGVGSQEGRVVIMTSNKPEQLDKALTRPGRVDKKVFLGNITPKLAEEMFTRMFAPDLVSWARASMDKSSETLDQHISLEQIKMLARDFAKEIPDNTFTPSQLQGFFQLHLSSAVAATSNISAWVKRELAV